MAWPAATHAAAPSSVAPGPDTTSPKATHRIDLLTVGPGDMLFTRAGHAALVVVEQWPNGLSMSTAYNFGDTDFYDPWLGWRFLFGQPRFRLVVSGDLFDTVQLYGPMQNRDVYRQHLALTPTQADKVAAYLARKAEPENREYPYHYLQRTCTTEIRTLLDGVLGGIIAEQLADPDPWTVRQYQQLTFDGDTVVAVLADVIFGRRHDVPIDRNFALMWPDRMRAYLQDVRVPDPAGGAQTVALASPPELMAERGGAPATVRPTQITSWFAPLAGLAVLGCAWLVCRRTQQPTRMMGLWLLAWSLPIGVVGLLITVFSAASTVPELGDNELVLSLLATDLALVGPALAWIRGRTNVPRWLPRYATVRLVVVASAVLLRGLGVFVQQPWVIPTASLLCSAALWWVVRRTRMPPDSSQDRAAP